MTASPPIQLLLLVALLVTGFTAVAFLVWYFTEKRRIAAEERRMQHNFERRMSAVELPPWNGETRDWTPESLAYLADDHAYEPPPPAVAPVRTRSPKPGYDPAADAEVFIALMRERTAEYIAQLARI